MNFEQALSESRELDSQWIEGGFELIGEKAMSNEVLDIYPLVDIDISVTITIKLPTKTYVVPLSDVSPLNINDCLVIGVDNLYPDWEERVYENLKGEGFINDTVVFRDGEKWIEGRYVGKDENIRVIRFKASSVTGYRKL
jgi:hypothetical protein